MIKIFFGNIGMICEGVLVSNTDENGGNLMDKQASQMNKRPRILTLCMLAATVGTLALAGCGNGEEEMPPAQQPETETMEQDATNSTGQAPAAENEPEMADEPMSSNPGLGEDSATAQEPMTNGSQTEADPEENPGFGEGTDPMPGADESAAEHATSGNEDDEMTNGQ